MPIRPLPPEVVARIAAGEVVERPVSVAKELIENSLDAGASHIDVEVQAGGIGLLRVVDDGVGIPASELSLAFERHATSKLSHDADLERIATLGFRGEALASIASVADVTLVTRTHDADAGSFMRVANGECLEQGTRGAPPGTSVTVRNLFRDVPARHKFLKSNSAETTRITVLVSHYALAFSGVRFSLTVDGKRIFASQGTGDVREAIGQLYGLDVAEAVLDVAYTEAIGGVDIGVTGMASPPAITRANRAYMTLFVNHRLIQHRSLTFAILDAYQGLLPGGRYPIAVLDITIDPSETDVNVHPTKAEVRFRDEGIVFAAVHRALRQRLLAAGIARPVSPAFAASNQSPSPSTGDGRGEGETLRIQPAPAGASDAPSTVGARFIAPTPPGATNDTPVGADPPNGTVGADFKSAPAPSQSTLRVPILRVLGQLKTTFIVAEGPDGMYLIDQHTAHERVLFDELRRAKRDGAPMSQGLLDPVTVTLTPLQEKTLHEQSSVLAAYGFDVEPFGERTALLRALPPLLRRLAPAKALLDTLDYILSDDLRGYDWEDRALATIACHAAVRAGQELSLPEMREMVRLLESADNPHACPHGRPVMVHMTNAQLEKEFSRR
ncbi:MAG: DNA mismatch repair endonuclease MutL [Chloroflexi bacterium]|nr:DNA mismatch repair endonuclease MutL [Chloroflexota bacterium]